MNNILLNLAILLLLFSLCSIGSAAEPGLSGALSGILPGSEPLVVHYFYNPECGDCIKAEPIVNGYVANHTNIRLEMHSLAEPSTMNLFLAFQNAFGLENAHVPILFVGEKSLEGSDAIKSNLDSTINSVLSNQTERNAWEKKQAGLLPTNDTGKKNVTAGSLSDLGGLRSLFVSSPLTIHYFFNPGCGDCIKAEPIVNGYAANHSDVRLISHSISGNQTNMDLFLRFQDAYGIQHAHVPIIYVGETSLEGQENIGAGLDSAVQSLRANKTAMKNWEIRQEDLVLNRTSSAVPHSVNLALLIIAGLGEGLNPCGLLVLALLLVSLMATSTRRTVLMVGLSYTLAFFIVRVLSGFAIFSVIQIPGISQAFLLIAGIIAVIAGIIQIKDGLLKEQKPLLAIPGSKKHLISTYMKRASIPAGFVVGFLVGIYGMACTAGIYISILGMIYQDPVNGLLYLIFYNLLVIVPLIAILLLVFFGIPPEKVNTWREGKKSLLRLMIGVIMLIMGIIILLPLLPA